MKRENDTVITREAKEEELEEIFRLRYLAYLRKGYIPENRTERLSDQWDALPGTVHLAAVKEGQVIGAVRLVADSVAGLPMERVFPEEVGLLRTQGRKLAEASTLVVSDSDGCPDRKLWLALCKAVWSEAEQRGIDDLCIAVTQNHLGFYERLLFERLGEARSYSSLNGILAYPLRLKVGQARTRHILRGEDPAGPLRRRLLG